MNRAALGVPSAPHDREHPAERSPVRLPRLGPVPAEVGEPAADVVGSPRVLAAAQPGVGVPERDQRAGEAEQFRILFRQRPVEPGQLVVLAVGVVVALLSAPELISGQQHGNALAGQQDRERVLHLGHPQPEHSRVGRVALGPRVPAVVVVAAVAVALAVGVVVLVVIGGEVVQGEAVVGGDEVHRGPAAAAPVQVRRARDPGGDLADGSRLALDVLAHHVAVLPVPFSPSAVVGEVPDLVQAPGVPGLRDQLAVAQYGVEGQLLEDGRVGQRRAVLGAVEDRRQVEPEAVNVVLGRPVAQAVEHEVAHHRMVAVHRVAGAAEVVVIPLGGEHVIGLVIESAERYGRPAFVALGRVVEHHVEYYLDIRLVQLLNERLELIGLHSEGPGRGIAGLRGEERDGVVAPEVEQPFAGLRVGVDVREFVEFEDRQELDAVDSEFAQVGYFLAQADEGSWGRHAGRLVAGEPAHVRLVDDQVLGRNTQWPVLLPVEVVAEHPRPVGVDVGPVRLRAPYVSSRHQSRVRVGEHAARVEPQAPSGVERALGPEAVVEVLVVQVEHGHAEDAPDAELVGEPDFGLRALCPVIEEHQGHGGCLGGVNGEVHPAADDRRAEGERLPDAGVVARDEVRGSAVDPLPEIMGGHRISSIPKRARKPVADMTKRTSSRMPTSLTVEPSD